MYKLIQNSLKNNTFSNLRFLVFFKWSYVKMRFLQNQGYRKYGKIDEKNGGIPTIRKIDAKREAQSHHCERRALTAAPLGETGESRLDGLTALEMAKTVNETKSWSICAQKASNIH